MTDLRHTKKDRKSLHQIIQIFIFNVHAMNEKQDGDKMSLLKIADDHI
jgi:hypothetical protein